MAWNTSVSAVHLSPDGSGNDRCDAKKALAHHLYVAVMVSAACIILLLCFTSRRTQHYRKFLWGIPSIVVPVDVLSVGSGGFRLVYCVVFACWGGDIVQDLLNRGLFYSSPYSLLDAVYFFMFFPTVMFLSRALAYFPVFACVDAQIPILGHVVGLLYSALLVSSNVYDDYEMAKGCSHWGELTHREIGIMVGARVWNYLLYLCLLVLFFMYSVFNIVHLLLLGQGLTRSDGHEVYKKYVKNLLKRSTGTAGSGSQHTLSDSLWNYLVRGLRYVLPDPYTFYLRYPLPLLGGFFMGFSMLFHLVVYCSGWQYIMAERLLHWLQEFQTTVDVIEEVLPSTKPHLNRLFSQVLSFPKAYEIILPLSAVVSFGLCAMFSLYMLQNTHKQCVAAARGDTSFFVRSELVPSLSYRLAATMRFTAFQVAFLVLSWMLYCFILWILYSIGLMFYYAFTDYRHYAVHLWSWFMVPMMWGAALHHVQLFLCKYVFLEGQRKGTLPLIRLKWLYNLLSYFLFSFNVIFGVVMCFLRVFGVVVFTVVMLFRMDWDVYMRGLEGWDMGHRTYLAYLYTEYTYNNMIMRLFPQLLLEAVRSSPQRASDVTELRSHRARLRWYLAFTLLRNQSLCQDRVSGQPHEHNHTMTVYGTACVYSVN